MTGWDRLYMATSPQDAAAALADRGRDGAPLAGATWIMRAPLRHEPDALAYVGISRIDALRHIDTDDDAVSIGASVTHAELASALSPYPEFRVLAQAAGYSANPAIRQIATIGGNLCTAAFPAADLVPALLCLDAEVDLQTVRGSERVSLESFLSVRATLEPGWLLHRVLVRRRPRRSVHIRLPLRKAGDYPVAIVSVAVERSPEGGSSGFAIAVGSVESVARRWRHLEADLAGYGLDPVRACERAEHHMGDFHGRDGVEAPGWYRVKVLPALIGRAVEALRRDA